MIGSFRGDKIPGRGGRGESMSAAGPEIVVLIAPVHDCLNPVKIEPGGKGIDPSSFRWILNPYDAFALEQALRVRDVIPGTRVRVMAMASSIRNRSSVDAWPWVRTKPLG